ncbi:DUF4433 domain-containing protein [Fervidobacterium sp. 2310opik-2]|uniref:DUF4433 domain-containing protein n=1 Tax=Fervidobacterium sp. 2310opik-2 TaxID=1755815 RepID=UPI0013E0B134|nr:DUF4433 domain-containing protein [Fervidobacterium sp. 2310opik-2]KAF2961042.1 hypothetical protein AS161_03445 [Fervidobacterium sp. 2310opik-2]
MNKEIINKTIIFFMENLGYSVDEYLLNSLNDKELNAVLNFTMNLRRNRRGSIWDQRDPRYRIKYLYYITPIENLDSILRYGRIFSRNELQKRNYKFVDFSDQDVQSRRAKKVVDGHSLHDYVNLYINPRNAMLYRYLKEKRKIAVLQISNRILSKDWNIQYSFRNASTDKAIISKKPDKILQNYNDIMSYSWGNNDDLKQIMQSEVLVLGYVPADFISRVFVKKENFELVKKILGKYKYKIEVYTSSTHIKDLFFEEEFE